MSASVQTTQRRSFLLLLLFFFSLSKAARLLTLLLTLLLAFAVLRPNKVEVLSLKQSSHSRHSEGSRFGEAAERALSRDH